MQRREDYCDGLRSGVRVARAMKSPARLLPRIVEGIVQVLWSTSGGVMEKHALNAGGTFENRANESSPYPHSRV